MLGSCRKYIYSATFFLQKWCKRSIFRTKYVLDDKLFDNRFFANNIWFRYDNYEPRKRIEDFNFPIATILQNGKPRAVVISTNVNGGATATFDGYPKDYCTEYYVK